MAREEEPGCEIPVYNWEEELRKICGMFRAGQLSRRPSTRGAVTLSRMHGLDVAQVRCDLPQLTRSKPEIEAEPQENMFLIVQLEGACTIRHRGEVVRLEPNGMALIDSCRPVELQFEAGMSTQTSFHLSRDHFVKSFSFRNFTLGLDRSDPRSETIRSFLRSMFVLDRSASASYERQHLLENLTMLAFARERVIVDHRQALYIRARTEIEASFRDPELSPGEVALRVGEPLRSIQLAFQEREETISEVINRLRLNAFQADLDQEIRRDRRPEIARLAFSAGFNDISYFNRRYKWATGMSPRQYVRERQQS